MNFELFNAILSMDSYNRGYEANIKFSEPLDSVDRKIGLATTILQSDVELGEEGVNIGFYALAYDYNGQKIISYRGTKIFPVVGNNYQNIPPYRVNTRGGVAIFESV